MKCLLKICVAALIIMSVLSNQSKARTWRVERDGSGDFGVIQDAVNAAASGDTIRIGPGRFNEGTIVQVPGWTELVRVLVTVEDLTLIGAGPQETIIGQEEDWDLSQGWHRGIQTATYWGTRRLVVEGIRFENMAYAINDDDRPRCSVEWRGFCMSRPLVIVAAGLARRSLGIPEWRVPHPWLSN